MRFEPADGLTERVRVSREVTGGLERLAKVGADAARRIAPRDTGAMADSIEVEVSPGEARYSVGTDHWSYVEDGTFKMPAQPFMRPSMDDMAREANTP